MEIVVPSKLVSEQEIIALNHSLDYPILSFLCMGVFDLFHKGHDSYLEYAAYMVMAFRRDGFSAKLVVGVASDAFAREYKGPGRPIIPETDRAEIVSRSDYVDYAFIISRVIAPYNIAENAEYLRALSPSFLVIERGLESTYKYQAALAAGVRIATISGAPQLETTTGIINKITGLYKV